MKIKLIIFDLDGTLVDSGADITNALNHATGPFGLAPLSFREIIGMVGEGLARLVEKMLGDERMAIRDQVLERFVEYYSAHLTDFTVPYPGIREALDELRNYRKVVISNKREVLSRRLLEDLELAGYFDMILGGDSVKEKKPSPAPIIRVLELLSLKPGEAVVVGDSDYDIRAGKASGSATIAVSYGYRDVSQLKDADFIISDIRELKGKIEELDKRAG